MKLLALPALFTALAALALGGCDKQPAQAEVKPQPAAATKSASPMATAAQPVKVMETAAEKHASKAEEGSCAGGMAEAESCEGGCDKWDSAAAEVAKRAIPANAEWKTIPVSGMTCGGCERRIVAHLGKVDGVLAVEADAELGQVRVAMAKGADLRKTAVDAINALGYSAQ